MKLYIVFQGEFCTDKPREYMAVPKIRLITTKKKEAKEKINELREQISLLSWVEQVSNDFKESFTYNNEYDTYGYVGILKEELNE
jgi:hypothetical protein